MNANQLGRRPSHRTNGESIFEQLDARLCEQDGHFAATIPGLLLQRAFRPIFSLTHRRSQAGLIAPGAGKVKP
ncbi:MAG: hypothetical protein ACYCRH_06685 [Acidiferrobacteraceae bacterium]